MNLFKKASGKLSAKKDIGIIVDYIKAGLKVELDGTRFTQNTGIILDLNDSMLLEAAAMVTELVNDFDEIKRKTEKEKNNVVMEKKQVNAILSPDENYAIEMSALKDIKKAGLKRPLTAEEKTLLKDATKRFHIIYSEQVKVHKAKEKLI